MAKPWTGAVLVGDAIRQRVPLWVTCRACGRRVRVDPGKIADRVGYDVPVPSLSPKMRCTRCGGRSADVAVGHYPRAAER